MPNTRGEPTTCVILSMTDGKSGMVATFKGSCAGCGELTGRLMGNSNGLVGEQDQVGLWSMSSMREPASASGGGSGGGGSKAGAAGKSLSPSASSGLGSTPFGAAANETEGARVCETGVGSPVGVVVWSVPTRREGPYPSHSSAKSSSLEAGQHSQSITSARCSAVISNSSQ